MQNLVSENREKNFRCPYFREEGGGQVVKPDVLIFHVFIRGRREGVKANKTNVLIYSLFFLMASLRDYLLSFKLLLQDMVLS